MNPDVKRQLRRDCRRFMRTSIIASFFHRLIDVAAPVAAAGMIGDMANHLLTLDGRAIAEGMPTFLCAVIFQVAVAALLELALNLLLTKQGFAYDGFLMEKFIRLPLRTVQTMDAGSVMERLEEDSAAFCWNQMILRAYPGAITVCLAVFVHMMVSGEYPLLFAVSLVGTAALPVVRTTYIGKRQTKLKEQYSQYNDSRKQMEQELFDGRDFARSFGMEQFFVRRLRNGFQVFLKKTGLLQCRIEAKNEVLDFFSQYGARLGMVLVGAVLIGLEKLTLGALLSGYLMIPAITQCCQYVKEWVVQKYDEKKYLDRLVFFYEKSEGVEEFAEKLQCLKAEDVTFAYDDVPVLKHVHFQMISQENCRLMGPNGSGKTTLMAILAGLYEPQQGKICDGASLLQRRKSVALQEQDGAIFSGTIWENLFLPESKGRQAAVLLEEMGLEKALEYVIAPEGTNLSPGERKKILLVRALFREAPFLLLDEPLNHLDEQGKAVLLEKLQERRKGLLLISHQELEIPGVQIGTVRLGK